MRGPYLLRPLQVDMSVPCRVGGVYALGKDARSIKTVGGSTANLRDTIKSYWKEYEFFWYQTTLSPRECYNVQCKVYHEQASNGGLEDSNHPAAPPHLKDGKCPVCGQ
jgi:hypothetical protein